MRYARLIGAVASLFVASAPAIADPSEVDQDASRTIYVQLQELYMVKITAVAAAQHCSGLDPRATAVLEDQASIELAMAFAKKTLMQGWPLSASEAQQVFERFERDEYEPAQQVVLHEWPALDTQSQNQLCANAQAFALDFDKNRGRIEAEMRTNRWDGLARR